MKRIAFAVVFASVVGSGCLGSSNSTEVASFHVPDGGFRVECYNCQIVSTLQDGDAVVFTVKQKAEK